MILLIFYLLLAILVSFLCSILEAVLLSITPSYVESLRQEKGALGEKLNILKKNIDRPLAAILSLNTIAHTVGAAGVGAQAALVFGDQYIGVISGVLTLLILVFSEIIPKTLGANYWRSLTGFTANTLKILIIILYPLVVMSQWITNIISKKDKGASVSREEISAMADIGHKEGVFEEQESRILKNLIRFKSITAEDVMTPRIVLCAAPEDYTVQQMYDQPNFKKFSRFPVYKKSLDNVTGYIHKNDVVDKLANDLHNVKLNEIKRDVIVVNEKIPITELFDSLITKKEQMAVVVDNYGGVVGMATMEDMVETLLGLEIVDEFDSVVDMQIYAREKWQSRAKDHGILTEEQEQELKQRQNQIKFGITGGKDD